MSSGAVHPRRTPPVTRSGAGHNNALNLKTNMVLRKGATFHSPSSPSSLESVEFVPPPLPRRSNTNLDDVVDAHRRRAALTLGNFDKALASAKESSPSSTSPQSFRDDSISVPRGILDVTVMAGTSDSGRRVLRRSNRRSRYHVSDSGLGTSIDTNQKRGANGSTKDDDSVKTSAITRSVAGQSTETLPGLSQRTVHRICEHVLKPLLAKPSLKEFHPLVLACPKKMQDNEIVCLRDLEKTLLLVAPERTKVAKLYLEFCITSVRCIQATVEYLTDRERTRPADDPYSQSYFIDLVEQIQQYAQQLADHKEKKTSGNPDAMDLDSTDEIKLHGGITINGRPAELVRVKKNGQAISIATGQPVELDEDTKAVRIKRSASEELEDDEEIMRSMARRKKNAPPEEYAPKKCGVPGCNKEFKRPCDLTKHEKTHSRPWKCPITTCKYHEYGWPTEKERDRHQNDKHAANPQMYNCQFGGCPYKSKRESNCKQHMEKAHNWVYVRTKTNGKPRSSNANSTTMPTPQLQNMSTPGTDSTGALTPPQTHDDLYSNIYMPGLQDQNLNLFEIPQELVLDYSPMDNGTPSTDVSSLDHHSAFQDMSAPEFTSYDDLYSANAQLATPLQDAFQKEMPSLFTGISAADVCASQPAPHFSPTGQGNAMLFTPSSIADVDEGFVDEFTGQTNGGDFILFPPTDVKLGDCEGFFEEVPSAAAGYSQPSSQNIPLMDWQHEYRGYSQH